MFDADVCYRALLAKDPRFDGLFFTGVSTTGIYCRSVCPARKPRRASCSFYPTAAAAENAGFRPCLRCRPELAPSLSPYEQRLSTAAGAIARIQAGCLNGSTTIDDLAAQYGMSGRQLRRLIKESTGVSPVQIAQTSRLLLAKQLLTDTRLPVTRIAFASGFSSVRRFNELFSKTYRLSPSRFRREATNGSIDSTLELRLSFRPPFEWNALLRFLAPRSIGGVEIVRDARYLRTVAIDGAVGWISVRRAPQGDCLLASVSSSLVPCLQRLLPKLRDAFDLHARPDLVDTHLGEDPILARSVKERPGLRVPGTVEGFELAWRAILGQQVSVRAATTIAARFAERFGSPVDTGQPGLSTLTPTPARVAEARPERLASIGVPESRARSIVALARLCADAPALLSPGSPPDMVCARLQELPGIGPWTAQYIAMRAFHWPDAFPDTDLAIGRALEAHDVDPSALVAAWSPWRAYAAMHIWSQSPIADSDRPGRRHPRVLPRGARERTGATPAGVEATAAPRDRRPPPYGRRS
jgi:AraC family transcriptional regulator of adaptative response / DNA-3-methyladenine glycosylase II